jgi:hypothetical protein
MKYFAKYLPVEGEIKKEENCPYCGEKCFEGEGCDEWQAGGFNKKLFLCSRDIQRNDTVYVTTKDYHNRAPLLVQEHAIETLKEKGAFQVIGEISPDATWVKEGDEFDEDEVQRQIYNDSGVDFPWENYDEDSGVWDENYWNSEEVSEEFKRVQIKGPCGHFH